MGSAKDLERGVSMTPSKQNQTFNLLDPSTSSTTGNKIYVKQVTQRHNDTELHLAAYRGDLESVKHICNEVNSQMVGNLSGADFDAEMPKIQASMVNELGETPLYVAAEKGHLEVVKELLKYSDKETLTRRSCLDLDPLHIAVCQGHHEIVKLLLDHDVSLCQTRSRGNVTPLLTAASKGHTAIVEELLSKDPSLLDIPISNGKNALHLAARSGHVETVKRLIEKYPQLARRIDNKGQTALHMAVKGASSEVVKLLLCLPDTNVNNALAIAEELNPSKESADIQGCQVHGGAVLDELRSTVTLINKDVHGIAREVRKLHRQRFNNSTNSVTVAVLFATISFASIFTVPGGVKDDGTAVAVNKPSFQIFLVSNALALFTSLAVVLIQTTMVIRGETKTERDLMVTINWLIWLASMCTSVAFMASSYIVVGRKYEWGSYFITTCGGFTMVGVFIAVPYYTAKRNRSQRKKEKIAKKGTNSPMASNSDVERIYAI